MAFYPETKKHISPSAFAQWHRQRSAFIRSYFKGEKTPETAAMKAGTKIHALIEAGMLSAQHRFGEREKELIVMLDNGVQVLGRPDSHNESDVSQVSFVDYKTGKENKWTLEELAKDLKMRMTAWLVLQVNPGATEVRAIIEWIGMEWDGSELVPTGEPSECIEYIFTKDELANFEDIIKKTINDINTEYEVFLQAPEEVLVDEDDVEEYVKLEIEKTKIETKQAEIKDRIRQQLEFSGHKTYECPFGTFYFTEKKTFEYPGTLKVFYRNMGLVLKDVEEIDAVASAAKKNYELDHEPSKVAKSFAFRAKKGGK